MTNIANVFFTLWKHVNKAPITFIFSSKNHLTAHLPFHDDCILLVTGHVLRHFFREDINSQSHPG